ncbi:hypothetical protein EPR50_G00134610 [Perca flavescens]|uniref:Uncharacterized protein n=1 Tax=Perca flavescens TaxID=8167 RepID=A0A484CLH6_PERFV|nr:uncharacterized protein LOC114566990 [Perca flavescens]TDH04621.1 hypothetical protein EPR50_G00134610 [Perca flavescens]
MSSGFHSAVSGLFQLQPRNSAVLQGSDARFNATVQGNWQSMIWHFQGIPVLIISESGDVTSFKVQFSARFCSSGDTSCVEFTIHDVNESGPVMCAMLGGTSETAQLEVQVPKPPDWTVLIAVVVSFGGSALLVLLIIGIIFCYKRRKEKQTNYLDEMSKRVRTQSQLSVVNAAGKGAYDNTGYVSEGQTSVAPSEHTDSGFCQAIGSNVHEVPVCGIQAANCNINTVDQSGFRKHRHVTIV